MKNTTQAGHSPGPWCVKRRFDVYQDKQKPGVGGTYIGTTRNREFVATTRGNGELPESVNRRCEADAKLIAAAPDLLDALRDCVDAWKTNGVSNGCIENAKAAARAAIAKAEGK